MVKAPDIFRRHTSQFADDSSVSLSGSNGLGSSHATSSLPALRDVGPGGID